MIKLVIILKSDGPQQLCKFTALNFKQLVKLSSKVQRCLNEKYFCFSVSWVSVYAYLIYPFLQTTGILSKNETLETTLRNFVHLVPYIYNSVNL